MADKKKKPKKIRLRRSETGAQFYQSESQRQERLKKNPTPHPTGRYIDTDLEKKMNEAITNRVLEGKMTPKQAGKFKAELFIDAVYDDASSSKKKMSSGGRAAIKGTEFKGTF